MTVKTINRLVDNNSVVEHESNGSFSSIAQSEGSEYQGELANMGRSVDITNLNSRHPLLQKKAFTTANNLKGSQ